MRYNCLTYAAPSLNLGDRPNVVPTTYAAALIYGKVQPVQQLKRARLSSIKYHVPATNFRHGA